MTSKPAVCLMVTLAFLILLVSPLQALEFATDGNFRGSLWFQKEQLIWNFSSELRMLLSEGPWHGELAGTGRLLNRSYNGEVIHLDQAFIQYWLPQGDLSLGKQRLPWGTGYFFNPTDIINPLRNDEFLLNMKKSGTLALSGNYFRGNHAIDIVVVGEFQPVGPDNSWEATNYAQTLGLSLGKVDLPSGLAEEAEYALKYSTFFGGYDLALLFYHGREDYPHTEIDYEAGLVTFTYPQKQVLGASFAGTIGNFGIWGELASSNPAGTSEYLQLVLGTDYTLPNGLHLLGEYYRDESINHYLPGAPVDFICLGSEYPLAELTTLAATIITPLHSPDLVVTGEITHSIAQDLELTLGLVQTKSSANGIFSQNSSFFPIQEGVHISTTYYF